MACERVPYASLRVVVDARSFDLQTVAVAFLASLRARGCSPNTERAYAGRVALYWSYCRMRRLDWRTPGFLDLAGLQRWLVEMPVPPRAGQVRPGPVRYRSRGTANSIMTVVGEFLRFGAAHGWVPAVRGRAVVAAEAAALHPAWL
ncbi:hypothetical protein AB0D65_15635 [Streptomyces griseoloalbus]|uniref:Integrase n=1 Tax=Streptomyces griseoloalbus TaxID=67303 RepID=A0ABV3E6Y7_9ACTN